MADTYIIVLVIYKNSDDKKMIVLTDFLVQKVHQAFPFVSMTKGRIVTFVFLCSIGSLQIPRSWICVKVNSKPDIQGSKCQMVLHKF